MELHTTRFGTVTIGADDIIDFPTGLLGLDDCRRWVLLADAHNDALGWLQCTTRPDVALAVVSPRRFVPGYQVRVARSEWESLAAATAADGHVLVIVSKSEGSLTLNLKAPLLINLERRVGRQVVASGDQPLHHELCRELTPLKRTA